MRTVNLGRWSAKFCDGISSRRKPRNKMTKAKPKLPRGVIFWSKVELGTNPGDCWLWIGAKSPEGYGRFGKHDYAHRVSYESIVGPIPESLVVDHLCRTRLCVNPAHMEVVTQKENILRGTGYSARHARKTHCAQGHEFTPENIYRVKGRNSRICKKCCYASNARQMAKRKALAN
jgi:hypothetical protein